MITDNHIRYFLIFMNGSSTKYSEIRARKTNYDRKEMYFRISLKIKATCIIQVIILLISFHKNIILYFSVSVRTITCLANIRWSNAYRYLNIIVSDIHGGFPYLDRNIEFSINCYHFLLCCFTNGWSWYTILMSYLKI